MMKFNEKNELHSWQKQIVETSHKYNTKKFARGQTVDFRRFQCQPPFIRTHLYKRFRLAVSDHSPTACYNNQANDMQWHACFYANSKVLIYFEIT